MEKPEQIIPLRKGYRMMGYSVTTGWRREKQDPTFPKRVEIGHGRFGLRLSEIENYIAARPAAVIGPPLERASEAQKTALERRRRIKALQAELARELKAAAAEVAST